MLMLMKVKLEMEFIAVKVIKIVIMATTVKFIVVMIIKVDG